ncbi:hypothetical protein Golob_014057 [Gossypium lobatum]|uniref:Uncharacterized protein n=1 Tax=Gossypium lobatum TaxID=34289 RepID=A0A7J8LRB7_9ROSI|nr:hypothetical protein [Gossypium lobatum]
MIFAFSLPYDFLTVFSLSSYSFAVLIDPDKRFEYDITGIYEIDKYTLREYLARFKGMILTCNGLGIPHTSIWTQQLRETNEYADDEKG